MADKITVSAYSSDYSDEVYKFHYGRNQFEFVPKSQAVFLETVTGETEFGEGIQSRYFEIPAWLANKLKGADFYTFL